MASRLSRVSARRLTESSKPDIASDDEIHAVRTVDRQPLDPLRKLQRIKELPALIEDDHGPAIGNRGQQARRLRAHDSHIILTLSTALRRHFGDLDRKEVFDPIEVTVRRIGQLGVGMGTGPYESKFHTRSQIADRGSQGGKPPSAHGRRSSSRSSQTPTARDSRSSSCDLRSAIRDLLQPILLPLLRESLAIDAKDFRGFRVVRTRDAKDLADVMGLELVETPGAARRGGDEIVRRER